MRITLVALLVLVACNSDTSAPTIRMLAENTCGADKMRLLVGLPFEARDFETEGRPLRVLPPGSAMTMDHRPDRLNVDLDEDGVITRIWCG